MATSDSITGLREQIMANAVSLFPTLVQQHRETFETVIRGAYNEREGVVYYMALLEYKENARAVTVATSRSMPTVEGALRLLLDVLALAKGNDFGPAGRVGETALMWGLGSLRRSLMR